MLPRRKVINRPVVTLWVNGRASEDRDEWTEELRAHCERCYVDNEKTPEVQADRIRRQRRSGDSRVAHWFDKRFRGESRAPEAWKVLRLVFLKKPDAKLEKGLRGFRAIAPLSVFSKWYTTVLVDMLHDEKEPSEWKKLHVGAERGVNCEHMQVLVTNIWEWQEDRRVDLQPGRYRYHTALMASLDVKTAFDVAKPALVSKVLTLTGVHGHLTAALLAEMQDVRGSASF